MFDYFNMYFFGGIRDGRGKACFKKNWTGLNIFYYLLNLVLSRFEYDLPETMDARFLELSLINTGRAAISLNSIGDIQNFQIIAENALSPYGYPLSYGICDYMGRQYGRRIPADPGNINPDAVTVRDNVYNTPPIIRILWYSERLTAIQTSLNAALVNLKGTTVIQCSREQREAVKRAWQKVEDGAPVILDTGGAGAFSDPPRILTNPQTPDIVKALTENYDKTMAEFLTEFGIKSNAVINKLSGVSSEELARTDRVTALNFEAAYYQRQKALKQAAEFFNVKMSVRPAFESITTADGDEERNVNPSEEEAAENENI